MDIKKLEELGFKAKLIEVDRRKDDRPSLSISKRARLTVPAKIIDCSKNGFSSFTPRFNEDQCELALLFHTEESIKKDKVSDARPLSFYYSKTGKSTTAYAELAHILRVFLKLKKVGAMRVPFRIHEDEVLILELASYKEEFYG